MDMIVLAVEDDASLSRKERRSTRKAIIVVDPWSIVGACRSVGVFVWEGGCVRFKNEELSVFLKLGEYGLKWYF